MANSKITALTALTGANSAPLDLLTLVDVSDATMAASGTNKSITRQELQTYNAGTLTTDVKVLDLSVTWNAAGVTFTGLKFNATSTASAAGSLLVDFQLGGSTYFAFSKAGQLSLSQAGVVGTPAIKIYDGRGFYAANGGIAFANDSGNNYFAPASGGLGTQITSGATYAWTDSATSAVSTPDLFLARDAANVLALRNSTTAQTFNHYGTYTSTTSFSRVAIKHATTTLASVSGATVTATSLIPAKANVLGVNTKVTVALGTGSGTTGYTVGDGSDADRWGAVTGTATTTDTDGTDATADPTGWFTAANNVVITAAGGNFDGTGSIFIDVAYILTEAD